MPAKDLYELATNQSSEGNSAEVSDRVFPL